LTSGNACLHGDQYQNSIFAGGSFEQYAIRSDHNRRFAEGYEVHVHTSGATLSGMKAT